MLKDYIISVPCTINLLQQLYWELLLCTSCSHWCLAFFMPILLLRNLQTQMFKWRFCGEYVICGKWDKNIARKLQFSSNQTFSSQSMSKFRCTNNLQNDQITCIRWYAGVFIVYEKHRLHISLVHNCQPLLEWSFPSLSSIAVLL